MEKSIIIKSDTTVAVIITVVPKKLHHSTAEFCLQMHGNEMENPSGTKYINRVVRRKTNSNESYIIIFFFISINLLTTYLLKYFANRQTMAISFSYSHPQKNVNYH